MISFYVEDDSGVGSELAILHLSVLPENDAPILSFVVDATPQMAAEFLYTEDDPPLSFGRGIRLTDVDSNITSARLEISSEWD